jgi:HK97 gp10 family phage protein
MQRTLQTAQSKAQSLARVKTGYMRQNIQPTSITVTGWGVTGVLTSSAEYSSFNEYGTFKMSAQPFMLPAQRIAEVKMKQFMTESLKGGFA